MVIHAIGSGPVLGLLDPDTPAEHRREKQEADEKADQNWYATGTRLLVT